MDRRLVVILLVGTLALAISLGAVIGTRLASTVTMTVVLAVAVGVVVGTAIGMGIILIGTRSKTVSVDELIYYVDVLSRDSGDGKRTPRSTRGSAEVDRAIEPRRDRRFSAVGFSDPPEGFDDE